MKRYFILVVLIIILLISIIKIFSYVLFKENNLKIVLTYNPKLKQCQYILAAYESVLEEEGIPFKKIDYTLLIANKLSESFIRSHPAIILPDCALQQINPETIKWFKGYLNYGGNLLVVYDVGIKDYKGAYLKEPLLTDLLGINYAPYEKLKDKTYTIGSLKIINNQLLGIPPGKIDRENRLIKGYIYGALEYPVANIEILNNSFFLLAEIVLKNNHKIPGILLKKYGNGKIYYVNLPLGHLKAYSDDLVLRTVIRSFLFKIVQIPHILNVPFGQGGLIINWHIDANPDWKSIPYMLENGYFLEDIKYSNHITAGDFRDRPGDGLGFDACGKGKEYVKMLVPFGAIGAHGGWAHNWFSYGILNGTLKRNDIYKYIKMNIDCLESITGYKIKEYSAPNGVHLQPDTTKILEDLGIIAYYYTGDSGSSPNRTFFNGSMVSSKVLAFPITPFEQYASLFEIWKANIREEEVEAFFLDLLNYIANERVIRLIYSHPYDIPHYPMAIKKFLETANDMQKKGKLQINTMTYFADFIFRFLKTKYEFNFLQDKKLEVRLENSDGLEGITLAMPKKYILMAHSTETTSIQDEYYNYYIILKNEKKAYFTFKF